jgi:hypothetical protein
MGKSSVSMGNGPVRYVTNNQRVIDVIIYKY